MDRPIIKTRMRPDLYKASWGNFTISSPGKRGASSTTITSTGSQTYTTPVGVDTFTITMYGGGGGGGALHSGRGADVDGGGGGGGSRIVVTLNEVPPGTVLTFNNGGGGARGTDASLNAGDGGNTTLSYGGIDYVAGGGEGSAGGNVFLGAKDGTGGVADCDSGANCTATNGNVGSAKNTTTAAGAALGDSAGAGGAGGDAPAPGVGTAGSAGKIIIS